MTEETTSEQLAEIDGQGEPVRVREGRWRTRHGAVKNIRPCEPLRGAYYVWPWTDGVMTFQDNGLHQGSKESPNDLVEYLGPIEPDKTQELPDKTQELPEYTPPDGWRVVRFGELLQPGDVWVNQDGTEQRSAILHWDASAVSGGRCIRRIEPEPQPEPQQYTPPEGWRVLAVGEVLRDGDMWVCPTNDQLRQTVQVGAVVGANQRYIRRIEPQPEPVQVREGRWRTRNGLVKDVTAMPTNHEDFAAAYPWWDGVSTWRNDGRWLAGGSTMDLLEYLGPIEPKAEPVPVVQNGLVRDFTHQVEESGVLDLAKAEQQIEELRSEVSYVQRLLGESRQRVTQLEELVGSLRTINEAQEKTVRLAGQENTDLQHRLNVVAAEWAEQAEAIRRLQIELDAAQQVPADSPELRQLRAELAEVAHDRDTYRHAHELLLKDANTVHERTKAMTVEAIAEWLEPVRLIDSPSLANETLQHLPQIMRSLVGLDTPEDVD